MSQQPPLIKPAQIDNLPQLSAENKAKYKNALTALWSTLEAAPAGTPQHAEAETRIRNASVQIMSQISRGNRQAPAGGVAGAAPNAQRPQTGGAGGQQQQQQQQQAQAGQPARPGGVNGMQQASGQTQQQAQQQPGQGSQMNPASRAELTSIKVHVPPQIAASGEQAISNYRRQWMNRAAQFLTRRDAAKSRGGAVQTRQRELGQSAPPSLQEEVEKCRGEMSTAHGEWETLKNNNLRLGQQLAAAMRGQQQAAGGGAGNQPPVAPPSQQAQAQPPSQPQAVTSDVPQQQQQQQQQRPSSSQMQGQGDVKMNMDHQGQLSTSPTQPQTAFQQQQPNHVAPSASSNVSLQQQSPAAPQSATQQAQAGFAQQNNMNQQRAPMHAQQQQHAQSMANSGMPQSAAQAQAQQQMQQQQQQPNPQPQHQQPPQRPQALTHQAAISQASFARQDSSSQQVHQTPQQPHPATTNIPTGLSLNQPHSAGGSASHTPTSAYAQPMQQQVNSNNTKFPIPKQLNIDPRTQAPVQGPPSRPTFSNAGMMGQPGVQRAAQFQLEGDGDRVLSKRKLDELVRQVTGSTEAGGGLTPDVEEAVLTLADDFVDNLITSACRLAKLRSSQTLDVRDLQIVLERNYGIRIPGYALDEVRTVRKFQPAEGWRQKMQAVQAGKVMGASNSGGKDA